ncbi:hypothetical protein D030_4209, partial [Vibrio parahaemolyticus AQ3810]
RLHEFEPLLGIALQLLPSSSQNRPSHY